MSYYLLDNRNPNGQHFYTTRKVCQHGIRGPHLIVLHTAEVLPDIEGEDRAGEKLANWAATTSRAVSWHTTIDSDSRIPMLPADHTGWHVRYFNRCSVGYEIATQAAFWVHAPEEWRNGIYDQVADQLAADNEALGIPLLDRRNAPEKWGVTTHAVLDPTRRTDPRPAFPFEWVLDMARTGWRYRNETPPHWAQAANDRLVEAGIVTEGGRLDDFATRGEVFSVAARLLDRKV